VVKTRRRVLPILTAIIVALGLSFFGIISGFFNFSTAFIPEGQGTLDPLIGLLNALILIIIAALGGVIIYLLLKHNKEKFLNYFFFISFIFMGSFMIFLFGIGLLYYFMMSDLISLIVVIVSSFFTGTLLALVVFYERFNKNNIIKNTALIIYGALIGSFLGLVLPTWTSLLLLIGLSIYDIFAVFKGPIKKIIELNENRGAKFLEVSYSSHDFEIGLGDLTFYSMATCITLKIGFETTFISEHGLFMMILPCLVCIGGIIGGVLITFKLLEKKELLPGLPIAISLGLGLMGIVVLVLWIL